MSETAPRPESSSSDSANAEPLDGIDTGSPETDTRVLEAVKRQEAEDLLSGREAVRADLAKAYENLAEAKQERRDLQRTADTDDLTGLPNRRVLNRALLNAEEDPNTEIGYIDGDGFGDINKKAGDAIGDQAIIELAQAIHGAAEEFGLGTRVFRRGGDEFVILAPIGVAQQIIERAKELYGARSYGGVKVGLTGATGQTFDEANFETQRIKAQRRKPSWRQRITELFISPNR